MRSKSVMAAAAAFACLAVAVVWLPVVWMDSRPSRPPASEPCGPTHPARAEHLGSLPILRDTPAGVGSQQRYSALPCDDDDGIGTVGWSGLLTMTGEDVVRGYYKVVAASEGWTLKGEVTGDPEQSGGLDLGYPDLCFQNDDEKGVVFEVTFQGHPRDRVRIIFVEAQFADQDLTCAQSFQ